MDEKLDFETLSYGKDGEGIIIALLAEPQPTGMIGMVTGSLFDNNILLLIDLDHNEESGFDYAGLGYHDATGQAVIKLEEELFHGLKSRDSFALTALFHEIGHLYHNHLNDGFSKEERTAARDKAFKEGGVYHEEIEADVFAAEYLGTSVVCEGLNVLKKKSIEQDLANDEIIKDDESIIEIDRRIACLNEH